MAGSKGGDKPSRPAYRRAIEVTAVHQRQPFEPLIDDARPEPLP